MVEDPENRNRLRKISQRSEPGEYAWPEPRHHAVNKTG